MAQPGMAATQPSAPQCAACPRTLSRSEQAVSAVSGGRCTACIAAGMPGGAACRVCKGAWAPGDAPQVQCMQCALLMHATCAARSAAHTSAPSGNGSLCPACHEALEKVKRQSRAMLVEYEQRLLRMKPQQTAARDMYTVFQSDMLK